MYPFISQQSKSAGFSLAEILVSLFILSVGMLGMASLQISGLRNSATSTYRTDATQLSYDIADCMRVNSLAVEGNVFQDIDIGHEDTVTDPELTCVQTSTSATVSACDASDMAAVDLYHWIIRVRQKLPEANIQISCNDLDTADGDDCTESSTHTITLRNVHEIT